MEVKCLHFPKAIKLDAIADEDKQFCLQNISLASLPLHKVMLIIIKFSFKWLLQVANTVISLLGHQILQTCILKEYNLMQCLLQRMLPRQQFSIRLEFCLNYFANGIPLKENPKHPQVKICDVFVVHL